MFKRWVVTYLRPRFNNRVYTVRRGLAKGLVRRGGFGFVPIERPNAEESFLQHLNLEGKTVYDIGGWEGVFTLFFARRVGEKGTVITFEPHPENYQRILENVRLNEFHNVQVRPLALGEGHYQTALVLERPLTGTGTIAEEAKAQVEQKQGARVFQVQVDSLDHQVEAYNLPMPDLVKIDVEGMELAILKGMTDLVIRTKPQLFIEVHRISTEAKGRNARDVVRWLADHDYSINHIENGQKLTTGEEPEIEGGHLSCIAA